MFICLKYNIFTRKAKKKNKRNKVVQDTTWSATSDNYKHIDLIYPYDTTTHFSLHLYPIQNITNTLANIATT